MAQRDQRRGLLGRHDAGEPGGLERIPLLHAAGADLSQRRRRDGDAPARDGFARRGRLGADVDHADAPARVDVRETLRLRPPTHW